MSSCGPHAIMETPAPLVCGIMVNNAFAAFQSNHQSDAASNCPHPASLSGRLAAALCPRLYIQLDWGRGCWVIKNLWRWMQESRAQGGWSSSASVRWDTVLLKDEELIRDLTYDRQQLLWQQHITIIGSIDLDSGIDDYQTGERFLNSNISQGSAATHLRCGGIFNDHFIANFLLPLMV